MATDTKIQTLVINTLTKEQFQTAVKAPTEMYYITDAPEPVTANDFITPVTSTNKGATKTQIDALESKINIAGTSGKIIGSYWFGKTKSDSAVPAPTLPGQNYYDFTTRQVYKSTDGATWTLVGTNVPPTDIDAQIIISSKFWDITEQENQHGGKAWWSHTNSKWSYSPTIYEDKPAGGASLPLLTRLISDHKFNDISYLDANTFSWQSGSVYKAVYEHLVSDFNGAVAGTTNYYGWTLEVTGAELGLDEYWTTSPTPAVGDPVYINTFDDVSQGVVSVYNASTNTIKVDRYTYRRDTSKDVVESAKTETFAGIEITYYLAEDGHRICLPDQETAVSQLYAKTGEANFYILDTANSQFKLPRTQKRKLIRAVKNGDSWYNLYSDGWVEQGGNVASTQNSINSVAVELPIEMANTNYQVQKTLRKAANSSAGFNWIWVADSENKNNTTTTMYLSVLSNSYTLGTAWQVKGYAADSVLANEPIEHEYYYVGNFEQTAIEQTAGLNTELFNNKVDVGHQVIAFQAPTAENNYTWYRKYADGWVEQGGDIPLNVGEVSFPIKMAIADYTCVIVFRNAQNSTGITFEALFTHTQTTTGFTCTESTRMHKNWRVEGMAA